MEWARSDVSLESMAVTTSAIVPFGPSALKDSASSQGGPDPRSRRKVDGGTFFVWSVWGAMFISLLAFVWCFGINVPFSDDWYFMPEFTGEQPIDAAWLWARHFEHRIPLPKL